MNDSLDRISDTLSVYQQKGVFYYGTDAVLLAEFVAARRVSLENCRAADLCSGTGIIPFLLMDTCRTLTYDAVEINADACALAQKTAAYNRLEDRYTQYSADIRRIRETPLTAGGYDFLTCNPPYMTADCGKMCRDDYKTIARHEILCRIDDVFAAAAYLLPTGASAYLVYRPDRLSSLFAAARAHRFEIKYMTAVVSKPQEPPILVLCEAKKDAKEGLRLSEYTVGEPFSSLRKK